MIGAAHLFTLGELKFGQHGHTSDVLFATGLIAEHLRAAVIGHSADPITSGRLTNLVRRNLHGILQDTDTSPDTVLEILKALEAIGDLYDTGGGAWVPTPARAVRGSPDAPYLVLGAWPPATGYLSVAGIGRYLTSTEGALLASTFEFSVEKWIGRAEPLQSWTDQLLDTYRAKLSPVHLTATSLEVYAPDHFKAVGRPGRWLAIGEGTMVPAGLRLFRNSAAQSRVYDRPYYLGLFEEGPAGPVLLKSVHLPYQHSRRLRFGLDMRLGASRTLRAREVSSRFIVDFPRDLPIEEAKLLALGNKVESNPTVASIEFPELARPLVRAVLSGLAVSVHFQRGSN
jgi:hypothetical protein